MVALCPEGNPSSRRLLAALAGLKRGMLARWT